MDMGTVHPLTGTESRALEALFQLQSSDPVPIRLAIGSAVQTVQVTSSDLNYMKFTAPGQEAAPLLLNRQVDDADLVPGAAFWTDTDWSPYDPQTSTLIAHAHRAGRTSTGISVYGAEYTIGLRQFPTQTRHDTGKARPIYIPLTLSDQHYPPLAYPDASYDAVTDGLPAALGDMFLCPITHKVMREPVIAADGHSYERKAILKWLIQSDKSPITNTKLNHKNLSLNWNLQKIIAGLIEPNASDPPGTASTAPPADPTLPGKKRHSDDGDKGGASNAVKKEVKKKKKPTEKAADAFAALNPGLP